MATINSLAAVCEAIRDGLAASTGFSATTVTDDDWRVRNNPVSIFVMPTGGGAQELLFEGVSTNMFQVRYTVRIELYVRFMGNIRDLYSDAQVYTDRVLAWLRANDSLNDDSGVFATCHAQPVTFEAQDVQDQSGVVYRQVVFNVQCLLTGLT